MTNYEILKQGDMLAEMEERMHEDCCSCVNYERCGEPASKPSKGACKAMWESYFKGADTPKKLADRISEASDCSDCPVHSMCGELVWGWECKNTILAWLKSENVLYDIAIGRK